LHEYIAICVNNGQMIKTSGRLCYQASPRECSQCFPHKRPEDFFLRERYIKSFFALVDHFISPSEFLKKRYAAWGLDANSITVIENGLQMGERIPPRALAADEGRGRFAYLGQINPFKGVDLILEAFSRLPRMVRQRVSLDVFGSGLESQSADFRAKVEGLMASLKDVVRFHGPYEQEELPDIMRQTDWVLMGSVWWENSPVVIQEAFKFGRPVLCPDIGGMAEKVLVGTGGLHYRARDPIALAAAIESCSSDKARYQALIETLPEFNSTESCAADHLEMYASLRSDKTQPPLAMSAHA
jgi:glycosyltransferase involved in cell wall biosynthesis